MQTLAILGLLAGATAHPANSHGKGLLSSSRNSVNISKFYMPQVGRYSKASDTTAQNIVNGIVTRGTYVETATDFVRKTAPGAEFRVVDDHYTGINGISHVHFKQTIHGLDVDNADFNVNIARDGSVFSFGNNFFKGKVAEVNPLHKRDFMEPKLALQKTSHKLGLGIDTKSVAIERKGNGHYVFQNAVGVERQPEAKLVYFIKNDGNLALTWRMETDVYTNYLLTYMDANGSDEVHGVVDYVSHLSASMKVFPWSVEDPEYGKQTIEKDPWNIATSPFTWFSDGKEEYNTTRGNNAIAGLNPTGTGDWSSNYRPVNKDRHFEYTYSNTSKPEDMGDLSVTQIFYTVNKYHDLLYTLGFNEVAGNFQANNNGKGGKGGDSVIVNAQDGWVENNAAFVCMPDGLLANLRVGLWNHTDPRRDSAYESSVVIHEYTHGLSNRLTGGPANTGCLGGDESGGMGEGWSDAMAVAVHTKSTDTRKKPVNFAHWVSNNPKGYRQYPYSTDKAVNPLTYGSANAKDEVHEIGTIWGNVLFEVMWNVIDKHGITTSEVPAFNKKGVPTDGRYLTMKLIMDGMALQPCNPTMPQARDAILDADKALTGGKNKCDIWQGFAKRGLGTKAAYGSPRVEDFSLPSGC